MGYEVWDDTTEAKFKEWDRQHPGADFPRLPGRDKDALQMPDKTAQEGAQGGTKLKRVSVGRPVLVTQDVELVSLHNQGLSNRVIAVKMGISRTTVARRLHN